MDFHGAVTDTEFLTDLLVGQPPDETRNHLAFAIGQVADRRFRA